MNVDYLKDEEFLKVFGVHLREVRKRKGYTQKALAHKIAIEISQISRIARSILNTSISTVYAIACALEMSLGELLEM